MVIGAGAGIVRQPCVDARAADGETDGETGTPSTPLAG
jgi:hypothetical protein